MEFDLSRVSLETRHHLADKVYKIVMDAVETDPYLYELIKERHEKLWLEFIENYMGTDLDEVNRKKEELYQQARESVANELIENIKP